MKHIFTFLTFIFASLVAFSQAPNTMSYQAVIRDANNNLVSNQSVGLQISILQGSANGSSVYTEIQTASTNDNGLVSIAIGEGSTSDDFSIIDWANGPYFIKTETDPNGGSNYTIIGTNQLLSVPYALYAATAGNSVPGPQGAQGPAGANGTNGTGISLTTDNGDGTFTLTYTDGSIFTTSNLTGPQGPQGAQGLTGATGNNGTNGTNGTDGLSAYEVWIGLGNTGTESDFINSLIGPKGPVGNDEQQLSVSVTGDTLYLQNGGFVIIPGISAANTPSGSGNYPAGTVHCTGTPTAIVDVTNPTTGKTWMDRNLGASQVAASSTDVNAYGDLYQWGRAADGHQCRNSSTTSTLSSTDNPGNGDFIKSSSVPHDWHSAQNVNLWQGVNGINNPCPSGYRLPTSAELDAERSSWSSNNATGAFASPLKLPMSGGREAINASLVNVGSDGRYWSSTVSDGNYSNHLYFGNGFAYMYWNHRAFGGSIRCLKD